MQRSSAFSLIPLRNEFKICSLNQETENSFVYSLECFSIVLLFFLVRKVGGIIRCIIVFDVILVEMPLKNMLCFNIVRLITTPESRAFFQRSGKTLCVHV